MADQAEIRLLLVDDEASLREPLADYLTRQGFLVEQATDAARARALLAADSKPDLVLLDIMMPGEDGLSLCRHLIEGRQLPVIFLTARGEATDRIVGLEIGADDYVVKPYEMDELLARIRALLRRASGRAEPVYEHQGVCINPATREVTVNGEPVVLSGREWAVLEPLLARPGLVLSRAQLEEKLYDWKHEISSNAVEVYIHGLRKKLGADLIQNVRGVGYLVPRA